MELVLFAGFMGVVIIIILAVSLQSILTIMYVNTQAMTMANKTSNNFLSYYNPGFGIKIQYPPEWIVKDQKNGVLFLSPPIRFLPMQNYSYALPVTLMPETVGVGIRNVPFQNASVQDLANNLINFRQTQNPELRYAAPTQTTLAGEPAYKIPHPGEVGQMKLTEILSMKGNKVYLLNYGYYSDRLPQTIQKMIDSFQITK
jgi:hypothetical protein